MMLWKCCTQYANKFGICQQIWNMQQWPQDWKKSVFIPIPKKGNAKECSSYCTIALISHASKVMLKILQARHQQYVYHELPDVQDGFRKGRGTRDQIVNIRWMIEKARELQENIYSLIDYAKALTVWITTNKASGGEGISVELFQILKDDAVKVLIRQKIWKTQQWPQD